MKKPSSEIHKEMEWPVWGNWAVIGALLTALLTVAATLNDIW
jgi:hypothetical protein